MQLSMHIDQTRCTGCYTCVIACKDWHNVPAGTASWMRVTTIEKGNYPDLFVANLPISCFHCEKPACIEACPEGAISKRKEDGIVVVNRDACLGKESCGMCAEACPYGAPQFGSEANAKMQKCDFCLDRWEEGKKPICVTGCTMRALDAGTVEEMRTKYGDGKEAEGFLFSQEIKPSVSFENKKDKKGLKVQTIITTPPFCIVK